MALPTSIARGAHARDPELVDLQSAVTALLSLLIGGSTGQLLQQSAGQPAWAGEVAWTTATPLLNSYATAGGRTFGYLKDAAGFVHLRGTVSGGTADTIFTMPVGYRPTAQAWIFATDHNGTYGRIVVNGNGNLDSDVGANPHTNVVLDGVIFDTR